MEPDDPQLRPQVSFLRPAPERSMLGRFERLEEDFARIAASLGRPPDLPRLNVSRAERGDPRAGMSPRTVRLIGDAYADDVAAFGYGA